MYTCMRAHAAMGCSSLLLLSRGVNVKRCDLAGTSEEAAAERHSAKTDGQKKGQKQRAQKVQKQANKCNKWSKTGENRWKCAKTIGVLSVAKKGQKPRAQKARKRANKCKKGKTRWRVRNDRGACCCSSLWQSTSGHLIVAIRLFS